MNPNQVITGLSLSFIHKRIFSGAKGFATGGISGGVRGFVSGGGGGGARDVKAAIRGGGGLMLAANQRGTPGTTVRLSDGRIVERRDFESGAAASGVSSFSSCGPGQVRRGGICVETLPDVDPRVVTPAERSISFGEAVQGAFGMPAIIPGAEPIVRLACPSGMVLGRDDLCYPKQVLRRDSKFRKWRPGMRPILTGGERRGITKAKASINKARKAVGLAALK